MYVATSRARAKENDAGTDGRLLRVLDLFRRREILYASRDRRCVTKITYGSTLIRVRTIFNLSPRKVPAKGPRELFQVRRRSLRRAQSKVALPPARRKKSPLSVAAQLSRLAVRRKKSPLSIAAQLSRLAVRRKKSPLSVAAQLSRLATCKAQQGTDPIPAAQQWRGRTQSS
jgi:hypothetical protein